MNIISRHASFKTLTENNDLPLLETKVIHKNKNENDDDLLEVWIDDKVFYKR